jgi:AbrB family looped-hinge helix DNA binding protein
MATQSKVTAQNQTSVPAEIRKSLGIGPGTLLNWENRNGEAIVRRVGKYSFADIRKKLFPDGPPKGPPVDVKKAIAEHIRRKHARH